MKRELALVNEFWMWAPASGDVALSLAGLVGSSGEVVGVERDPRSISRAKARVADAGLHDVPFIESEVAHLSSGQLFDAVVGRCILMFLPDSASVLRLLSQFVRPGGVLIFPRGFLVLFSSLPALCRSGRQAL